MPGIDPLLRGNEDLFSSVFRHSPFPSAVLRIEDDRVVVVNEAFLRAFGFGAEEVEGRTPAELGFSVRNGRSLNLSQKFRSGVPAGHEELVARTKSGKELVFFLTMQRFVYGGEDCVLGRGYDVTEQKRAEAELKREREILQTIFDHSPIMFCFFDRHDRKMVANRSWVETFGWTLQELEERNLSLLSEVFPDPAEYRRAMDMIAAGAGRWTDFDARTRSGRMVAVRASVIRLSTGESICIAKDVTEHKSAEKKLKAASEELRALFLRFSSAREEQGRLIAREIHDELGSVLTGMRWELESIQEIASRIEAREREEIQTRIERILRDTQGAVDTIRRVTSALRPALLDGAGLEDAITEHARNFETKTGVRCRVHREAGEAQLDDRVSTALFRITQEALTNVARHSNATEAAITLLASPYEVALSVEDNGRGITDEDRRRPGALGLVGMRERAHAAGGSLEVHGVPGRGTTVRVRVPLAGAPGSGSG